MHACVCVVSWVHAFKCAHVKAAFVCVCVCVCGCLCVVLLACGFVGVSVNA